MQRFIVWLITFGLFATPCWADEFSALIQKRAMHRTQMEAAQEELLTLGLRHPIYTGTAIGTLTSGLAAILNDNLPTEVRFLAGVLSYLGASYCRQYWEQGCGAVSGELVLIGTRMIMAQQALTEIERQIASSK